MTIQGHCENNPRRQKKNKDGDTRGGNEDHVSSGHGWMCMRLRRSQPRSDLWQGRLVWFGLVRWSQIQLCNASQKVNYNPGQNVTGPNTKWLTLPFSFYSPISSRHNLIQAYCHLQKPPPPCNVHCNWNP